MRRTTIPLLTAAALAAAACGGPQIAVRSEPTENVFVPQVVEFEGLVGPGLSMATDAEGNPHLAYLAFEEKATPGATPAPPDPTAPKLPAVKHAHLVENVWTRSVVAEDQKGLGEAESTAIAVDGEGVHHIAWTAGGTLYYANNAEGDFSKPREVASPAAPRALAIATDDAGTPWIAFYGQGVQAATLRGDAWTVEDVARPELQNPLGIAVGLAGEDVLVAYGGRGGSMLARRTGGTWATEVADEEGGLGVSMDVDRDGNPHLAYATSEGQVKHAHSIGGGPWEVSTVADSTTIAGPGSAGPTTIAVDAEGVHHVAWGTQQGIGYATNREGEFAEEEVPGAAGGTGPRLGTGAEGALYLAWYDDQDGQAILAIKSEEEPLLAVPSPTGQPTGGPTGPPTGPPPCEPDGTDLTVAAPAGAAGAGFDKDCLAAPAGDPFTIDFTNQDSAVHNVNIYTDESATDSLLMDPFEGPVEPGQSATYEGDPIDEPGQYFYRCDFHPSTMTGTFVVQ